MICTVTGTLKDLTGQVLTNTKVVFYRSGIAGQDGDTVIPQYAEAISNGSGEINVNLYSGEYTAEAVSLNGAPEQFTVGVPDQASAVLSDLIDQNPPLTPSTLTDTIDARDAALQYRNDAQGAAATAAANAANGVRSEFEALEAQAEAHEAGALGAKVAAEIAAASAVSVVQQDLSALPFDIPAGAVAITPIDAYEHGIVTWPVLGNQSWRDNTKDPRSAGAYLGVAANETAARAISGAADGDHYWNSTDKKVYSLNVTSGQTEIFRAGSANFPTGFALAIGSYVYLLDASSDKHIWRVEDLTGYTINALTFVSGQLWIGTTAGVIVLDYATGETTVAVKYDTTTTPAIVNNTVNAVAATVLPNAPIVNGVPVPTIAVATDDGVSVIKEDGSVVSAGVLNGSWKARHVHFDATDQLWAFHTQDEGYGGLQLLAQPPFDTVEIIGGGTDEGYSKVANVSHTHGVNPNYPRILGMYPTRAVSGDNRHYAAGHAGGNSSRPGGVTTIFDSPQDREKSMVAYQSPDFTTPPMFGDVKGAFLNEQGQAGPLVGANYLTEDFSGYASTAELQAAWVPQNGSGVALNAGAMEVTRVNETSVRFALGQTIPAGSTVTISWDVTYNITSAYAYLGFDGSTERTPQNSNYAPVGSYTHTVTLTAARSDLVVFLGGTASFTVGLDNIKIDVAHPDRSVNGKGLIINGSLTQDADGWVSGFNAVNNFVQPYNPDLDFGTGDFFVCAEYDRGSDCYFTIFDRYGGSSADRIMFSATGTSPVSEIWFAVGAQSVQGDLTIPEKGLMWAYRQNGVLRVGYNTTLDPASAVNTQDLNGATAPEMRFGIRNDNQQSMDNVMRRVMICAGVPSMKQIEVMANWIGDNVAGTFQDMWFDPQTKLQHVLTDTYYHVLDENGAILSDKTEPNTGSWTKLAASPFGVVRAA